MATKSNLEVDLSTEQKIKEAARKVFLAQGYERTKVRQIADEAGVNLALVNYYFRSKEQLFKSIYAETFAQFLGQMVSLMNEETPLEVKIWRIVDRYTDFIVANPLIPGFILSEAQANDGAFFKEMNARGKLKESVFRRQLLEEAEKKTIRPVEPMQVIVTIMSNVVFPVLARPIVSYIGSFDEAGFQAFMESRKQIVPEMIMAYLRIK